MNSFFNRFAEFPKTHQVITPADADIEPAIIYAGSSGNLVVRDAKGTEISYAVLAGDILPVIVYRVAAATTVTQVIALR